MVVIERDVVVEGRRLVELAARERVGTRLLGGVAIRLRTPFVPPAFVREYADLDFVAASGSSRDVLQFFWKAGYESDHEFNAIHGKRRLILRDRVHSRKVDVFVGEFAMCHKIPLDRLVLEPATLPLAELLLTKLQVVELNEKDVKDALALLHGHEISDRDGDTINGDRVARLCAGDWGLSRTITGNLDACRQHLSRYLLDDGARESIAHRAETLLDRVEAEPKSLGWRLRARVGERVRWYELPEEVGEST
jgi:hypothetical protein